MMLCQTEMGKALEKGLPGLVGRKVGECGGIANNNYFLFFNLEVKYMTTAKEFMEKVKGKRVVDVEIVKGMEDIEAGDCQFEFTMEDGLSFVV